MDKKKSKSYNKWITEGYKYFALSGPKNFSIIELSKISGLSRTSFNYYFYNKEYFFDLLIEHHIKEIEKFGKFAISNKSDLTNSIIKAMERFNTGMKFHTQLFNNREISKYNAAYLEAHKMSYCNGILDWFIEYFNLNISKENGKKVFLLFIDVLNTRFNTSYQSNNNSTSFSKIFTNVVNDFRLLIESKQVY